MTTTQATLVLLAGIPGAGKTETLRSIGDVLPAVRVSDSDNVRARLTRRVPWIPYPLCRPVVHTLAHLAVLIEVLRRGGGPIIVHDPGTRWWSRRLLLWLALLRGYEAAAVFIDISREEALRGQMQRGRIVREQAFRRHWLRWVDLRGRILMGEDLSPGEHWPRLILTTRDGAVDALCERLGDDGPEPSHHPGRIPVRACLRLRSSAPRRRSMP